MDGWAGAYYPCPHPHPLPHTHHRKTQVKHQKCAFSNFQLERTGTWMDWRTDRVSYRVACLQLKRITLRSHNSNKCKQHSIQGKNSFPRHTLHSIVTGYSLLVTCFHNTCYIASSLVTRFHNTCYFASLQFQKLHFCHQSTSKEH